MSRREHLASLTIPPYFLPSPPMRLDEDTIAAFERLFIASTGGGQIERVEYTLSVPKWQFLCYLCEQKGIVLHGSGDPNLDKLEPRKATDVIDFGNREAVYAAADGIWPIFFAIVNRDLPVRSLVNSCAWVVEPTGGRAGPYYFFSIDAADHLGSPWREGTVYLLPGETFERQAPQPYRGMTIEATQAASPVGVRPLAKLAVGPADFPFLDQVRRHDPAVMRTRASADPDGFPWLDEV
jgi:hypothetical protein